MQATAVLAPRPPRIVPWSRLGDEALAGRAAAGNNAAFTALYERYYGPLLGYCRSILLDAEDARDATQSALENALRALPAPRAGPPAAPVAVQDRPQRGDQHRAPPPARRPSSTPTLELDGARPRGRRRAARAPRPSSSTTCGRCPSASAARSSCASSAA